MIHRNCLLLLSHGRRRPILSRALVNIARTTQRAPHILFQNTICSAGVSASASPPPPAPAHSTRQCYFHSTAINNGLSRPLYAPSAAHATCSGSGKPMMRVVLSHPAATAAGKNENENQNEHENADSSSSSSSCIHSIEKVAIPVPKPHQVLVRMKAVAVNPLDLWMSRGYGRELLGLTRCSSSSSSSSSFSADEPLVLGREGVGVVEQVGGAVWDMRIGDLLWVTPDITRGARHGTFAEYLVVDPKREAVAAPRSCIIGVGLGVGVDNNRSRSSRSSSSSHIDIDIVDHGNNSSSRSSCLLDAAALPYAILTAWRALGDMGNVLPSPRAAEAGTIGSNGAAAAGCCLGAGSGSGIRMIRGFAEKLIGQVAPHQPAQTHTDGTSTDTDDAGNISASGDGGSGPLVFIHGGASAVGRVGMQLAMHYGARVAVGCSERDIAEMSASGAVAALDYQDQDYMSRRLPEWLSQNPVDVFLDLAGISNDEAETFILPGMTDGSRFVTAHGDLLRQTDREGLVHGLMASIGSLGSRRLDWHSRFGVHLHWCLATPDTDVLRHAAGLVDQGVLQARRDVDAPLFQGIDSIPEALAFTNDPQRISRGKVVVQL